MNRVPSRYIGGAVYFRMSDSEILEPEGYFRCLKLLKPLFTKSDFQNATPGFYINYVRIPEVPGGSLRLTCFSIDGTATRRSIENFINETSGITQFKNDLGNGPLPTEKQDVEELKFWNCLDSTTQILLDLFEEPKLNWQGFQHLAIGYRLALLPLKTSPETAFEPVFKSHSDFYRKLESDHLENQYWDALFRVFSQGPPIHFLINMALTWDDPRYDPQWFAK